MSKNKINFNQKDIEHIAQIYKVPISKSEAKQFVSQLFQVKKFLESFNRLKKKIQKLEPTHHVGGVKNRFKQDVPEDFLSQKEALSGAVETYQGYFRIPIVIKKDEKK